MTIDFFRIQEQFHASKRQTSPIILTAGPFTCYLHPESDAHFENYAIPHVRLESVEPGDIGLLKDAFRTHRRRPRLEYIEACAPTLERALHAHGYLTESRTILMICTPESLIRPAEVPGVRFEPLDEHGSLEDYRGFKTVETRSFWQADAPESTLEEAEEARRRYGKMPKVAAKLDGAIIAVGTQTFAHAGIAEVAGIATLPEYRRRGIAAAVTARLAEQAFAAGLDAVFLTAADEAAGRVYTRAGFQPTRTWQVNISRAE